MWCVNKFGRVVELEEIAAKGKIASGRLREATESEVAEFIASRPADQVVKNTRFNVYYSSVRRTPDGYGTSRDILTRELADLDIGLSEHYEGQKVGLLYNYPYTVESMRTDVRLVYTMFESSKIPEDFIEPLLAADEVIVPSRFCQEVFARDGIKSTVVPLGYDGSVFYPRHRKPVENGEPYVFIHYDGFNMRKGFKEVFEAFTKEFGKDPAVKLIIKTVQNHPPIPVIPAAYPNIEVISAEYTPKELCDLLARAHCMVYPSRGEGFGITPLEAMATGLPAIVPNAHGIAEYFNKTFMLEVKVSHTCPGLYNRFKGQNVGDMVVCDVDDLRRQMRWAFENQSAAANLGYNASEYVKAFTYAKTAQNLARIIDRWERTEVVRKQNGDNLRVERV